MSLRKVKGRLSRDSIGFESADSADVNISFDGTGFFMSSRSLELGKMSMMTQAVTPAEPRKASEIERDGDHISKWDKDYSSGDAGNWSPGGSGSESS